MCVGSGFEPDRMGQLGSLPKARVEHRRQLDGWLLPRFPGGFRAF
jgi:hypothetical protein